MSDRYNAVIVDDDGDLLDGLKTALRAEPYDVHTARDAESALPLIQRVQPEVIVSDYQLPGLQGTELLAQVRSLLPDSCRILMTGSPSLPMACEAVNDGAISRLFLKPFPIIHLAAAMRDALERAEMARLSLRLLAQARANERIVEHVRQVAPHLLDPERTHAKHSVTGAAVADDYHPHDHGSILRALRQRVR
jgi:DNA-binding NtrC family response regulator